MIKKILPIICLPFILSANENYLSLKYGLTSLNNDGISFNNNSFESDLRVDGNYEIYPRIGLSYISIDEKGESVSSLIQATLEGGYDLSISPNFTPYLFAGGGYESVQNSRKGFDSQFFIDGGVGLRYPIDQNINLLTELKSLYMLSGNDQDSELALYVGFDFNIGGGSDTQTVSYQAENLGIDSDGDGVSDNLDRCPNTPIGIGVDTNGCPVIAKTAIEEPTIIDTSTPTAIKHIETPKEIIIQDSDGDGIEDRLDKCPNTPKGFLVTSSGCPIKKNLHIRFEPNSTQIPFKEKPKIAKFADYIKNYPNARIKVVGYTDNSGDHYTNLQLSKKRAISVKNLLVKYGIQASKIKAIGKGELNPIAPNDTKEGREKNRRIEVEIY